MAQYLAPLQKRTVFSPSDFDTTRVSSVVNGIGIGVVLAQSVTIDPVSEFIIWQPSVKDLPSGVYTVCIQTLCPTAPVDGYRIYSNAQIILSGPAIANQCNAVIVKGYLYGAYPPPVGVPMWLSTSSARVSVCNTTSLPVTLYATLTRII